MFARKQKRICYRQARLVKIDGLTVAVAVVADSYGATQEAGGPAEVAGARVSDVVVATDLLLSRRGDGARSRTAHDAVSAVGLVGHTGVGTGTHHAGARLCVKKERANTKCDILLSCRS